VLEQERGLGTLSLEYKASPASTQSSFSHVHEETGYHLPATLLFWLFPMNSSIECC
jgi:hypothetical protein